MTRHRTPDGEYDLGDLITAAFGLPRDWTDDALCLAWTHDTKPTPWQVSKGQRIDGVPGAEMIKMALMVCSACPVQYECASYAVQGKMQAGTWAMGITNLTWLIDQWPVDEALDIIEMAKECGAPLDPFVTQMRRDT